MQLIYGNINEAIHRFGNRRRQLGAPFGRFRLNAKHYDLLGYIAEKFHGNHEIGKPQLMHGWFTRQAFYRLPFETQEGPGRLARIDGIDDQHTAEPGDMRQQAKALSAAIDENDIGRDTVILLQSMNSVHTGAVVTVDQIPQPKDEGTHWCNRCPCAASIAARSSSSSSSTGTIL